MKIFDFKLVSTYTRNGKSKTVKLSGASLNTSLQSAIQQHKDKYQIKDLFDTAVFKSDMHVITHKLVYIGERK